MARTVIIGEDQHIVTIILHILSYFIRCSEVFEQPVEQSPKNLASYLESLETQLEPHDLGKDVNTQVKSKCDTISEKSEECSTGEPVRSTKEYKLTKCSEILSQNSKSYMRDAVIVSENLETDCNNGLENSEKNSELSKNSQTMSTAAENVDSCGEDSGICSIDFDSSVEILRNDAKNCLNGFEECSEGRNISENWSQNCENFSRNSTICKKDSENCSQDSENLPENCVKNSTRSERDVTGSNDDKCISKKCEKCIKNCKNCIENSRDKIRQKSDSSNYTEDKLCEGCDKIAHRTSSSVILEVNTELCNCNGVFSGNSKEHKLWKSFLKSSCCNRNSRSLNRQCLSTNSDDSTTKPPRRCSSEKSSDFYKGSKLCVQNDGEILSLDRQSILDMFLSSYPLCPVCKGQLNFMDQDFAKDSKILGSETSVCLCQDCDKVKSCSCQVVETDLGENRRCASSMTVNSDSYSSGISLQSFEGERYSLSSLSVDSGLNEHCLQSSENLVGECTSEDQACTLELPEAQ